MSLSQVLVCCVVAFSLVACDSRVASSQEKVADQVAGSGAKAAEAVETEAGSGAKQATTEPETKPAGSGTAETAEPKSDEAMAEKPAFDVIVADGVLTLKAPGTWEKVKPRFRMLEAEIKIPKSDGEG